MGCQVPAAQAEVALAAGSKSGTAPPTLPTSSYHPHSCALKQQSMPALLLRDMARQRPQAFRNSEAAQSTATAAKKSIKRRSTLREF